MGLCVVRVRQSERGNWGGRDGVGMRRDTYTCVGGKVGTAMAPVGWCGEDEGSEMSGCLDQG